jgi:DNA-binding transcriptional LysR family regulator
MSRRSFPLNAIDAFLKTARHLNLTHAAKELCLTQGAVSRKIASLEAWFGFPLLSVTPAGCGFPAGKRPASRTAIRL